MTNNELAGGDVTLAHDWLTGMRGGERVLQVLCGLFPDAPITTLFHNPTAIDPNLNAHPITTSFLQAMPGIARHYRYWLPLFPAAVEHLPEVHSRLLLSTSHCVAKAVRAGSTTKHVCYCFTPMRYAWLFYEEYFGRNAVKALAAKPLLAWLRRWDRAVSDRVHRFVAISHHVRKRIEQFYGREADVVYPPVDTVRCTPDGSQPGTFDLMVSALVPYKKVDLAVAAYNRSSRPLTIVGTGIQHARLQAIAKPNIELLGWQSDEEILALYRKCRALVFPGEEDFGIVPLEAQSCGRPVVAFGRGGALETVKDGVSGVFFSEQTEESLLDAVERSCSTEWDPAAIRAHAETFGADRFVRELSDCIRKCLAT